MRLLHPSAHCNYSAPHFSAFVPHQGPRIKRWSRRSKRLFQVLVSVHRKAWWLCAISSFLWGGVQELNSCNALFMGERFVFSSSRMYGIEAFWNGPFWPLTMEYAMWNLYKSCIGTCTVTDTITKGRVFVAPVLCVWQVAKSSELLPWNLIFATFSSFCTWFNLSFTSGEN